MSEGGRELKLKSDKDLMALREAIVKREIRTRPASRYAAEQVAGPGEARKSGWPSSRRYENRGLREKWM